MFSLYTVDRMRRQCLFWLFVILTLAVVGPAAAHHGAAAHYNSDDLVEIEGIVTHVQFVNPHAVVHLDVASPDGELTSWRCEMSGATQLTRRGWTKELLVAGHSVQIIGARARREANACAMESIVLADGRYLENDNNIEGIVVPETVASSNEIAKRPGYLDNGQPNISGPWVAQTGTTTGGEVTSGPPEPTPAGLAAAEDFDFRFDNPVIRCESGNIISDWYRQSHVNDIQQSAESVQIHYGYLDLVRTIYLGEVTHPENLSPSVAGHSIGRWDGDVLEVDTVALRATALHPRDETMISDSVHIQERFWYNKAAQTLVRDYTVTDPLYLAKPFTGRNISDISARPYQPFDCVDLTGDNNRRQ
ncbi:MAG: hypothetical protein HOJ88_01755 [Proteobacteria bacterium]|nr:hypothetical protein [Pseudomonadota bacterium]